MNKRIPKNYRWKRNRIFICFFLVCFFLIRWMQGLSTYLEPRLQATAKQYVNAQIYDLAQQVLKDIQFDPKDLITIQYGENQEITDIQYDSAKLNEILYTTLARIENRTKPSDTKENQIQSQMETAFSCPIGYLTKIAILADKGFEISMPMRIYSDVTGEIQFDTVPYGINSTKVQASMRITVRSQVITVMDVTEMEMSSDIPVIMQIVHGEVPQVLPYQT